MLKNYYALTRGTTPADKPMPAHVDTIGANELAAFESAAQLMVGDMTNALRARLQELETFVSQLFATVGLSNGPHTTQAVIAAAKVAPAAVTVPAALPPATPAPADAPAAPASATPSSPTPAPAPATATAVADTSAASTLATATPATAQ